MKKIALLACMAAAISASAEILIGNGDRIAFLGDSITANGNRPAGYVNMVMKGLEVAGVKAEKVPAGVSGHKSNEMLARLDKDVISKNVKWMTFRNCSEIFDKCAAAGIKVIVLTATMIREDASNKQNTMLVQYNDWLRAEAKRRSLPLADLNADMQAELGRIRAADKTPGNKLTRDGVHMAFPGDCMMAWGVLRAMGVDESRKDEILAAWRDMPGAYRVQVDLTANEYERLKASGKRAVDIIRSAIEQK